MSTSAFQVVSQSLLDFSTESLIGGMNIARVPLSQRQSAGAQLGSFHAARHLKPRPIWDAPVIRAAARKLAEFVALKATPAFQTKQSAASGPIDVVDLFCGCGGLSSGFEIVGKQILSYRLASAVDLDRWAIATYSDNLPVRPHLSDLSLVLRSESTLEELIHSLNLRAGAPLVLVGGPPCQGFSAHRKKDGRPDDPRNHLMHAFAKLAERLRPDVIIMENVPELLAHKHWNQFEGFRSALEDANYILRTQIHNLAAFGVPQERFRAVVIASKKPIALPSGFLDAERYLTVRDAIGSLPAVEPGESGSAGSDALLYSP